MTFAGMSYLAIVLAAFYAANSYFPYANSYGDNSYQCTNGQYSGRIPKRSVASDRRRDAGSQTAQAKHPWKSPSPEGPRSTSTCASHSAFV